MKEKKLLKYFYIFEKKVKRSSRELSGE